MMSYPYVVKRHQSSKLIFRSIVYNNMAPAKQGLSFMRQNVQISHQNTEIMRLWSNQSQGFDMGFGSKTQFFTTICFLK
jgi:hypothetical protein